MRVLLLIGLLLVPAARSPGQEPADLWSAGRRAEAIEALSTRLAQQPSDDALRRALATWQLQVHRYAEALETLRPLGAEVDPLRGLALYRLARWEEALDHLSTDDPAHALLRLEALEALGRAPQAHAELARTEELVGASDPRLLSFKGRALARQGRHAEAIEIFERALAADPLAAAALLGLGQSLVALGQHERGLEVLERHRALASLLDRLEVAQHSVDLAPLHAPNLAALADAERALGRVERAEALYARAVELADPTDLVPIALRHARLLEEDRADPDAAVSSLEAAAARSPDARLYVRAGDMLLRAGRPIEAVQRFLKAGELRPADPAITARIEAARAAYRRDDDG